MRTEGFLILAIMLCGFYPRSDAHASEDEQGYLGGFELGARNYPGSLSPLLGTSLQAYGWFGWDDRPWMYGLQFHAGNDANRPALPDDFTGYNSSGGIGPFFGRMWGTRGFRGWARAGLSLEGVMHDQADETIISDGLAINLQLGGMIKITHESFWLTFGLGGGQNWLRSFAGSSSTQGVSWDASVGVAFLPFSGPANAELPAAGAEPPSPVYIRPIPEPDSKRWHLIGGFGFDLSDTYFGTLQQKVDTLTQTTILRVQVTLGIYYSWPEPHTLIGLSLSLHDDWYIASVDGGDADFAMTELKFGPSIRHYFGHNPGSGIFLRGDLGLSWFRTGRAYLLNRSTLPTYAADTPVNIQSIGPGAILGTGYAFSTPDPGLGWVSFIPELTYEVANYPQGQNRRLSLIFEIQL